MLNCDSYRELDDFLLFGRELTAIHVEEQDRYSNAGSLVAIDKWVIANKTVRKTRRLVEDGREQLDFSKA